MFIMGTNLKLWIKLLYKNKFIFSLRYLPRIFIISIVISFFTPLVLYEYFRFNAKIKTAKIKKHPVFIIGHWRSGTTHLQNLLLNDNQFGYLNLVEATFPYLMLSSYNLIVFLMKSLIPKTRPMDSMKMSPITPQEHEFALTNLCLHSPLTSLFFLNRDDEYLKYALLKEVPEKELEEWKSAFIFLIRQLTFKNKGKRLLLKNPLDTFRIETILEMFPKAKFIHIYRNPYDVFFSMIKLYKTNTRLFWLNKSNLDLENFIFRIYSIMFQELSEEVQKIPSDSFIEIKYEDLVSDPIKQLKLIYEQLSLGDYSLVKGKIEDYISTLKEYKADTYNLTNTNQKQIYSKWKEQINRWNY